MKTRISPDSLIRHGFVKVILRKGIPIYVRNGVAVAWAYNRWFFIVLIHGDAYLQRIYVEYVEDIP